MFVCLLFVYSRSFYTFEVCEKLEKQHTSLSERYGAHKFQGSSPETFSPAPPLSWSCCYLLRKASLYQQCFGACCYKYFKQTLIKSVEAYGYKKHKENNFNFMILKSMISNRF